MKTKLPQVVMIGRANVGKSTMFNRLIEKNKAIVSDVAGTTRDRNMDKVFWQGQNFMLIDTGGLDINPKYADDIETNVIKQSKKALAEADLVLFLVDAKSGVLAADKKLAKEIVKDGLQSKTVLVGNKADSIKWHEASPELYKLNLGEPHMTSAASGSGCGDLLDEIVGRLPNKKLNIPQESDRKKIKVAIVGKPNVGKSSIINSILGEERVIVTDTAHTTRESHDMEFTYKDQDFILVDTAGIIRKSRAGARTLSRKSIDKSFDSIKDADVAIFVTEAHKKIDALDKKVTQEILENSTSIIIVANKWDLIPEKDTNTINKYIEYYYRQFPYMWWAPIIFTSAKEDSRTKKILDMIIDIEKSKNIQLNSSQLHRFLKTQVTKHRPARGKGNKNPYIYTIEQVRTNPPRFLIYVNDPLILHFSYIRYLQNNIRKTFNILGTPIQIETKQWNVRLESKENKKKGTNITLAKERSRDMLKIKQSKKKKTTKKKKVGG